MLCTIVFAFFWCVMALGQQEEQQWQWQEPPWAVLVCSSRYWFNYRHLTNTLMVYRAIRALGVPDDQILFMNAMTSSTNDARNPFPGMQFASESRSLEDDLFGDDVEVDYQGEDVNAESFLNLLTDRNLEYFPSSMRLRTNANSTIFIYLSGHGGDEFFKFQDTEEISSEDLGRAVHEMHSQQRYKEIFLLIDTCQASTLANHLNAAPAPGVTVISSSSKGENSYAYQSSQDLSVALVDRFTLASVQFFRRALTLSPPPTLQSFLSSLDPNFLFSTPTVFQTPGTRPLDQLRLADFIGNGNSGFRPIDIYHNLDLAAAKETADQFIEFCKKRGIVLQDDQIKGE